MPIWQRRLAALLPNQASRTRHEPKGKLLGDAVAKSFFGSLKKERIKKRIYKIRSVTIDDTSDYIENFYNSVRRHSYLQGMSPSDYEATIKRH